ncbi:hypothetical protein BD626DRAFT_505282 [Schizophyllum amplum]|uniref:F-box domain-containing protein n=1 Tax=Schizophyllum amplum TaxID=97359 RepID=A0A550C6Q7_9AGAR|nr:hypothetical protein BD626DRAFT_505282 [Auriculariopsis ampla]
MLPPRPCIDMLATELLEVILLYACAEIPLILPPSRDNLYPHQHPCPALVLTWVCRRWRDIAIAKTELWAPRIEIQIREYEYKGYGEDDDPEYGARVANRTLAVLQCYLDRSRSAPLQVNVQNTLESEEDWRTSVGVSDIVQTICLAWPRWKTCILPGYLVHCLSATMCHTVPELLEAAEVPRTWFDIKVELFRNAPRLRFWKGPINNAQDDVLPYAQLTELHVGDFTPLYVVNFALSRCQQLVRLTVCICLDDDDDQGNVPTTLPYLESAKLTVDDPEILVHILSTYTTPKLSRLELVGVGSTSSRTPSDSGAAGHVRYESWPMEVFDDWLARSGDAWLGRADAPTTSFAAPTPSLDTPSLPLDTLTLRNIAMPRADVVAILERLPHLSAFTLEEDFSRCDPLPACAVDDTFLRRMTCAADGTPASLLPRLKSLELRGLLRFDVGVLAEMLESRAGSGMEVESGPRMESRLDTRIESLHIYGANGSTPDKIDESTATRLEAAMVRKNRLFFTSHAEETATYTMNLDHFADEVAALENSMALD